MSMAFGSAMDEDIERDSDDSGPMAISSSMKEDIERESERYHDDSMAVGSAMKEDLKIRKKYYKNRIKYHDRKKI